MKVLKVTTAVDGFRRAGRAWSKGTTTVPVSEFSKDEIAQLKSEPKLVVEEDDAPDPKRAGDK